MADVTPPASGTATPTAESLTTVAASKTIAAAATSSTLAPLDASLLKTTLTTTPQPVPSIAALSTTSFAGATDHMVTCSWHATTGWSAPNLVPYGPLSLMPTASVLHYATTCFEGMRLYRGHDSKLRLFRPSRNAARMLRSATRCALPAFAPDQLEALIAKLCATDGPKWLPAATHKGRFLYIRPTLIADAPSLGVQKPAQALLYVILTQLAEPVVERGPDGVAGLRLLASREDSIRAWPGGFGFAKLGANYGPSLVAQGEARERGFTQVLWLFGKESYVTEAGASNFFVVWRTREGRLEMVTAGLEEGVILEGVTRDSILALARERFADVDIVERQYTMQEIKEAMAEGRMVEAFAAGTAFFVAPVGLIEWKGETFKIPLAEGSTGTYARQLRAWLSEIMYGVVEHEWGVVVQE